MVCWFCAARSAAGFGGRRDMAGWLWLVVDQLRCLPGDIEFWGRLEDAKG